MSVINNENNAFSRYPVISAIIVTVIVVATVVGILLVVSAYEGQNINPEDEGYLYRKNRTELVRIIKTQKINKNMEAEKHVKTQDELTELRNKLSQTQSELHTLTRQQRRMVNLHQFTCFDDTTQGDNVKYLVRCLSVLKLALHENFQVSGRFPSSMIDLGFTNDFSLNDQIETVMFKANGAFTIIPGASYGTDKYITLTPHVKNYSILSWTCETNLNGADLDEDKCM